jgi:hypothetical protein
VKAISIDKAKQNVITTADMIPGQVGQLVNGEIAVCLECGTAIYIASLPSMVFWSKDQNVSSVEILQPGTKVTLGL